MKRLLAAGRANPKRWAELFRDQLPGHDSGRLSGAVLDVFRAEHLAPDHPFWVHPRVTVSPNVASLTHPQTAAAAMAANIRRYEGGQPLLHIVDRARGY
jgi:glyoxylate/hydroxypyruvate reductase